MHKGFLPMDQDSFQLLPFPGHIFEREHHTWLAPYTTTSRLPSSPPLAREVYNSVLMVVGFCRSLLPRRAAFLFLPFLRAFCLVGMGRAADPTGPQAPVRGCVE